MKKASLARFAVFVIIHVLLCISAALYAQECVGAAGLVQAPESGLTIDGSDFTPLAELMVFSVNGMLSGFLSVVYVALMTVFSIVLLLPFRFISVRRFTVITRRERNATMAVIIAGTVLAVLAVMIFCGLSAVPLCLLFLLPTLLIEILMYWLTLYFRSK